jgi:hypothetical protein
MYEVLRSAWGLYQSDDPIETYFAVGLTILAVGYLYMISRNSDSVLPLRE